MRRSFVSVVLSGLVVAGAAGRGLAQSLKMAPSAAFSQLQGMGVQQMDLPDAPAVKAQAVRGQAPQAGSPEQAASHYAIRIPEPDALIIDPTQLRPVNLQEFDRKIMPQIMSLQFFSYNKNKWLKMPYKYLYNNCFARRAAVDAFLWFGAPLKADLTTKGGEKQYLLPGFKDPGFKNQAWVETARINVIGQLQLAGGQVGWNNHETVAINTDQGVMVVDPSFADHALTLPQWFANFAPDKTCQPVDNDMMININLQLAKTEQFHQPWDPKIPHCGYTFGQRLDAGDTITATAGFYGTAEQKFLSSKFYSTFETALSQ